MKKIFFTLILFGILNSCTDLSVGLYDKISADEYPQNQVQAERMVVPVFQPLLSFPDGGGWWFAQELTTDLSVIPVRGEHWYDGGKWIKLYTHSWTNDLEATNNMWDQIFNGIYEANKVIELLQPKVDEGDELAAEYQNICRVMRAYYYWLAIDNYGDVPFLTSYSQTPEFPEKEDKEVIWDYIVTDLLEVIPHLSLTGSKNSVTKGMAMTLLVKLYLNAETYTGVAKWTEADSWCDSIINSGAYSLDLTDPLAPFVTENENSPENIFTVGFDEQTSKGFNLHMRTLHYLNQYTFDMKVAPWNGIAAVEDFYNSFDENDLRKKMFLVDTQYSVSGEVLIDSEVDDLPVVFTPEIPALDMSNTAVFNNKQTRFSGVRYVKYEVKNNADENLSNDLVIFRYADVLLMKAETQVRINGVGFGDDYINQIRNRAGLVNITNATLDDILEERAKELVWEGHRRQDLIRFDKFLLNWWEKPVDDSPDRIVFPIPKHITNDNPNLLQ